MAIKFLKFAAKALLAIAMSVVALWSVFALLNHPWTPSWLGVILATAYVALGLFSFWKWKRRRAMEVFGGMSLAVLVLAILPQPTHDRPWAQTQAVMPTAEFKGDQVMLTNLRRTARSTEGDYTIEQYNKTFDLGQLDSVWFGVQHFSQWKSLAHTFVSFGFAGGDYLAISIESRRRQGEPFSPVAGMYRNYGMIYTMGDELEIIGPRSVESDDPIYLYPIKADPTQMRAMLLDMLGRANQLSDRPEFYDTWTNNCTNNIVRHFNKVAPESIWPYSADIAFPGYTGQVAYDHGLIDSDEPFEEIQQRARINKLPRAVQEPEDFSAAIRRNLVD